MTRLVILAYGKETEHRRAIFAILSFWAWFAGKGAAVRTLVFTDRPDLLLPYFGKLPVDYELLTAEQLGSMKGPQYFVHRVKVAIIAQVFGRYPDDNVLFCDSDTFFVAESEQLLRLLQAGVSLMHQREYRLAEAVQMYADFNQAKYPRKFIDLIKSRAFQLGGKEVQFHERLFSWNSGVVGLTSQSAALLPDIMSLTDALYAGSGWFTSEQMAFSLALQTTSRILPSNQYVFHYWGQRQKHLMDSLLANLLTSSFGAQSLVARLEQVRQLTTKWWRTVELDKDREGALYAFSNGNVVAGIKCTMKALIASPFNAAFAKDVVMVLSRRTKGTERAQQWKQR